METKKIITGIAAVTAIGGVAYLLSSERSPKAESDTTTVATTPAIAASKYKSGAYSATSTYTSPGGEQEVNISIQIDGDKIADAKFTGYPKTAGDKFNQGKFADPEKGFKQLVVGKSIDEVRLDVVNGSSLTPKGFMSALEQIKKEAKS